MSDIRIYEGFFLVCYYFWTNAVLQFMNTIYKHCVALAVKAAYGLLCQRSVSFLKL